MRSNNRERYLKLGVGIVVGLFLLDRVILSPAIQHWKEQSERITSLREKVTRGRQLLQREKSLRARWADMVRTDLPDDISSAESDVFKGIGRWGRESKIGFTSLAPQWRSHEDAYDTYECRATAVGDQASLGRLLYEIEADPLPARIEDCEMTTRDPQGKQISMSLRFSFLRLTGAAKEAR